MSAYIVSKKHIDYIVSAALASPRKPYLTYWYDNDVRKAEYSNADEIGAMLLETNVRSVAYRYPNNTTDDLPGPANNEWMNTYRFSRIIGIDPVQALKAIHCFEYQSCELPDWHETEAFAFCQRLQHELVQRLPRYDEAAWAIA